MKTKLGISVGLLGAAAYFIALTGGMIPLVIIAGYILLFETNEWLKMAAIKAVAVVIFFAVISAIINLIPNAMTFIDNIVSIFNKSFHISIISKIITLINTSLAIVQKLLLLALGFKAFHQGTISFGVVDRLIATHTRKDIP